MPEIRKYYNQANKRVIHKPDFLVLNFEPSIINYELLPATLGKKI